MGDPRQPRRAEVFGCPVDAVTMSSAVERVGAMIAARVPARLGAVNAAKLVLMEQDPRLHTAVSSCELILPDGIGVVWAAWLLDGIRLRRVTGIDLMERLIEAAAARGHRVYFLGAKPEILDRMIAAFRERLPGLVVAGSHHGYFKPEDEPALVAAIRDARPDLLFVGMGTPAKEFWIDRHFRAAGVPVSMGVGGSFDVFAGHVKRAPRWAQRMGLEWFVRFVQEPRRLWRRYFVVSLGFLVKVLGQAFRRRVLRGAR